MVRKSRLGEAMGQLSMDFEGTTSPTGRPRPLARKLAPPQPPVRDPRLATPIPPPWAGTEQQQEQRRIQDTRVIGASLTTGTAGRRALEDVGLRYDMFPVASSRVSMMGYREDTRIVRVIFRDGTPWQYFEVPPQVWTEFKRSESPGRFINEVLNHYPYGRGRF